MKRWYKSRTIVLARLMMLISIVQEFAVQIIPADYSGYVLFGAAIIMELMRWVTDKPMGVSVPVADDFTGGEV